MIRRPPRSTHCISSAASDVYKRQSFHGSSIQLPWKRSKLPPEASMEASDYFHGGFYRFHGSCGSFREIFHLLPWKWRKLRWKWWKLMWKPWKFSWKLPRASIININNAEHRLRVGNFSHVTEVFLLGHESYSLLVCSHQQQQERQIRRLSHIYVTV